MGFDVPWKFNIFWTCAIAIPHLFKYLGVPWNMNMELFSIIILWYNAIVLWNERRPTAVWSLLNYNNESISSLTSIHQVSDPIKVLWKANPPRPNSPSSCLSSKYLPSTTSNSHTKKIWQVAELWMLSTQAEQRESALAMLKEWWKANARN